MPLLIKDSLDRNFDESISARSPIFQCRSSFVDLLLLAPCFPPADFALCVCGAFSGGDLVCRPGSGMVRVQLILGSRRKWSGED